MEATTSWLAPEPVVERLELDATSWVDVVRGLVPEADGLHDELAAAAHWEQGRVFRYERWVPEPRLYGTMPSGRPHPAVVEAGRWLTRRYRVPFGDGALARYRNERDSVGFHRDRELRWLDDTRIAVLSLGATRPWLLRPLGTSRYSGDDDGVGDADVLDVRPASGDLLVMGGRCQAAWLHAVPKVAGRCGSRISVQWRWTSRGGRRDPNPRYSAPRFFGR